MIIFLCFPHFKRFYITSSRDEPKKKKSISSNNLFDMLGTAQLRCADKFSEVERTALTRPAVSTG